MWFQPEPRTPSHARVISKKKEFLQKLKSILFITNQFVLSLSTCARHHSLVAIKNKRIKNKRTFVILSPYATKKRALYKQVGTEKTAAAALKGLKFAVVKHPKSCRVLSKSAGGKKWKF